MDQITKFLSQDQISHKIQHFGAKLKSVNEKLDFK